MLTITVIIVVITVLVSLSAFRSEKTMDDLIYYPPAVTKGGQYYRLVSSGFIHADIAHLAFNMFSFYLFGRFVEEKFIEIFSPGTGKILYLVLYISALVISLLPTHLKHKHDSGYRSLGASGAVSAIVFAGLMIAPYVEVGFFIIPPFIPGFIFGPLYLIISAYLERKGGDNINHSAHLWGAIYGVIYLIVVSYSIAQYDAISAFVEGIRYYFNSR
jgi:membrane associated rhomboid family serine protease